MFEYKRMGINVFDKLWIGICVCFDMLKKASIFIFFLLSISSAKSQITNWHLTAHAGTANYHFENFQGAFLTGFRTEQGQQFSFGPVVKGYEFNTSFKNVIGGRIYSQAKVFRSVSMYLQCDVFDGMRSHSVSAAKSPMRLETGAGMIYTFRETVGLSAGYNLGELNPINGLRKNTPSIKLIYLMPVGQKPW